LRGASSSSKPLLHKGLAVGLWAFLLAADLSAFAQEKPKDRPVRRDFTRRVWVASQLLPGSGQVINRQYWKLPVYYGGMGTMLYLGLNANQTYKEYKSEYDNLSDMTWNKEQYKKRYVEMRQTRNLYLAGAGAFYLASVVDALLVYEKDTHSPAKATILSTIVPGMGQVYNKKYWKVPIVYGGLTTFYFMASWNNRGYVRYRNELQTLIDEGSKDTQKKEMYRLYKDSYRRNRDVCILCFSAMYILNILDANVDANLYDWNVDDNLSFRVEPSLINTNLASGLSTPPAIGLSCKFNF
jgi:hypothetical protein